MGMEYTAARLEFHRGGTPRGAVVRRRRGHVTSDGVGVSLQVVKWRMGMLGRMGVADHRRADRVEHPAVRLVNQRVLGIFWTTGPE